ncbi:amino acid/polyamine/organocation transporter, APC superfamily [Candidatus Koribacter versatilis Ellin345]|uniref:Amino acid/polyamine/organocation transporter, APC superfamily n=1 Tax=Koribacter versatilis (strain Ellin345) TaxID=204669 RepID=Q1IRM4_KORVE|nr:amino acid permease [Candidatus Koribacter versatilis]ABF40476.1 amino acid/polyamine/organocation transporter, APC superfamily [Candidatus Koribacter versatilis Ellin345]
MSKAQQLVRSVGLFDATMLVMGGIVGSGIFINPYVVAQQVHTAPLILGAWLAGGVIATLGAFIYAELAGRQPSVGGQYAYLRDAIHPLAGFLYGWVLLLVIQTGGMAAVTVTFARYFLVLTHWAVPERVVAVVTLSLLTLINCLGVKFGSRVQSALMILKIGAIAFLVVAGFLYIREPFAVGGTVLDRPLSPGLLSSFGAAMVPVLFAFGGWQTANFVAGEVRDPRKNLARALLLGVAGVIVLYLAVNFVCVRALGPVGLAATRVPATDVMRLAMAQRGATIVTLGITVSTLGFLSQSILTAPRVYFAMAEDGVFFRAVAKVNEKTHVPILAIVLQSVWTIVVALTGRYEQILNYVVSMDFVFFGLTACTLFVFRKRSSLENGASGGFQVPGHPWTTLVFIAASWLVVTNTIYKYPANSLLGFAILLVGMPVYWLWRRKGKVLSQ